MVNTITQRLGPEAEQELEDHITVVDKDMRNSNMVNRVDTVDNRVITGTSPVLDISSRLLHPPLWLYYFMIRGRRETVLIWIDNNLWDMDNRYTSKVGREVVEVEQQPVSVVVC